MPKLKLKPTYKVVKAYYTELDTLTQLSLFSEGAVSPTFAALLRYCAGQFNWTLAEQFSLRARGGGLLVEAGLVLAQGTYERHTYDR